jgi:hypothetical protein
LWNCEIVKLWNCEIVKLWNCEIVKLFWRQKQASRQNGSHQSRHEFLATSPETSFWRRRQNPIYLRRQKYVRLTGVLYKTANIKIAITKNCDNEK